MRKRGSVTVSVAGDTTKRTTVSLRARGARWTGPVDPVPKFSALHNHIHKGVDAAHTRQGATELELKRTSRM